MARPSTAVSLTNQLVMPAASIQIFVFLSLSAIQPNIHPLAVIQLRPGVTHCSGPDKVSPAKYFRENISIKIVHSQLSSVDLSTSQESWSWILSPVSDGPILRPMEMGILRPSVSTNGRMKVLSNFYLKILRECGNHLDIKFVGLMLRGRLREGPELIVVVLRAYQGGDHGESSGQDYQ